MTNLSAFVVGASGRMGAEVCTLIEAGDLWTLSGGISRSSDKFMSSFPEKAPQGTSVVIDFSMPTLWNETLKFCEANRLPLVSGTTGLSSAQIDALKDVGKKVPTLWAPNLSLGVAVMVEALKTWRALDGFGFQIEEYHHHRKKDRPSGTGIFLQNAVELAVSEKLPEINVMRAGGIYGVHRVHAVSDEEHLLFEHQALNRTVFARGALSVAEWIVQQKPGLFTMSDFVQSRGRPPSQPQASHSHGR